MHQQGSDERSEGDSPISVVLQTVPPEHTEVARSIHVAGVDLVSVRVDEIVLHEHLVPRADEVDRDVVGDL